MTWTPIIAEGDPLNAPAWDAAVAIAESIERRSYPPCSKERQSHFLHEEPLLSGYMALALKERRWLESATRTLNAAIERPGLLRRHLGLFGGLCGLGWVVEHLSTVLSDLDASFEEPAASDADDNRNEPEDANADIDVAVLASLGDGHVAGRPYDLISGYVGFGAYFLERLPSARAEAGIRLVLDRLDECSQQTDMGLTWHSGPELLPDWQRDLSPGGYYNIGVAHGIPGVLFLLSEVLAAGLERERAGRMLEDAMRWFLSQKRPEGSRSWYSAWIPTPPDSADSRLAWCYGDLGVLAVLYQIGRQWRLPAWIEFTNGFIEHCLSRIRATSGIVDAPLCHGAIGNAHIFNRLYQATGDERCREAALAYLNSGLRMRQPDGGVAGFFQYTKPDLDKPPVWEPSPAFLDGAIGVGLGLLAALAPIEPQWDRLLLLSGRFSGNSNKPTGGHGLGPMDTNH